MQESILIPLLKNEAIIGQGFLARCLMVSPLPNAGNRPYSAVDLSTMPAIRDFWENISKILDFPPPLENPTTLNELAPRKLHLVQKAKTVWINFHSFFMVHSFKTPHLS